ncbi:MAG: hypothetical protein C4537_03380 [Acholeplasma sp.]|jgi:hypothetical protein|nr:MAG: hypothetical protein C4537_03380 [Acholeplasma sp.]
MKKLKVFISFDYEHDLDIKNNFIAQSQNVDIPFIISDISIKDPISEKWKIEARNRIQKSDCMIVLCGESTKDAKGVAAEVSIAQELNKRYILIKGRKKKEVTKPLNSLSEDQIIKWKWKDILKEINNLK